ncbi:MAG: class I SAM-dependent methyltransferase [Rubripirellula sp.]|nr:class I SAM-dependent methyltransferase [Rubripirellula sp.]MDA9777836.1 cyclopropane-fatty-acyl-phospholipid synthase family protein [Rubripirellula sp.]
MTLIQMAEKRWLPDPVIRMGMRRLLRERLEQEHQIAGGNHVAAVDAFAERQRQSVVTIETHLANEQHYEVPAAFFQRVLGSRLKYSCGLWGDDAATLDSSEVAMLRLSCERAGIEDGMRVLDLGCGWGSMTLWLAEQYPNCQITALSNSKGQRAYIEGVCRKRGYENVRVITTDAGEFDTDDRFDRVISVEMLEHVRNHEHLFARISRWLETDGLFFVHVFCHRQLAYTFEQEGEKNWMGRHFFSGGIMPSEDLFARYQRDLLIKDQWWVNGNHYAKTSEAWLSKLDQCQAQAKKILSDANPQESARVLVQRWRMFFMACAELFRFDDGEQWGVAHYRFGVNRESDQAR